MFSYARCYMLLYYYLMSAAGAQSGMISTQRRPAVGGGAPRCARRSGSSQSSGAASRAILRILSTAAILHKGVSALWGRRERTFAPSLELSGAAEHLGMLVSTALDDQSHPGPSQATACPLAAAAAAATPAAAGPTGVTLATWHGLPPSRTCPSRYWRTF